MNNQLMNFESNERPQITVKRCIRCGGTFGSENFSPSNSFFYKDKYLPICDDCLNRFLIRDKKITWESFDKVCQWADLPFVPEEFVKVQQQNKIEKVFHIYAKIMQEQQYKNIGWKDYQEQYEELEKINALSQEVPGFKEQKLRELKEKWGSNYSEEELAYLEDLYSGVLLTQNINGALQHDQALKLCKISLEVDSKIREGADFDKLLSSYDKLVKIAEFTPKNTKNANDFDSCGELFKWLEKRGWKNKFYDNVTRDIIDETMKNIQSSNQRLYTNESGIGDEITQRLQQLKQTKDMENFYDTNVDFDQDEFENEGFEKLMSVEEFEADI